MAEINPTEFLWLKGRVYTLECRIAKVVQILEASSEDEGASCQIKKKVALVLRGLPVEECQSKI